MNDGMNALVLFEPLPPALPPAQWWERMDALTTLVDLGPWHQAKYLLYARTHYYNDAADWKRFCNDVAEAFHISTKTIANYIAIAKHWPDGCPEELEGLSLGHFDVVVALSEDEQWYWLHQAKGNGWSVDALRQQLRGDKETQQRQQQELQRLLRDGSWTVAAVTAGWVRLRDGSRELDCKISEWRIEA